jgi:hypothetical protein
MPDMRHKLDKKTADRHFPNWSHGGKGDHARKTTVRESGSHIRPTGIEYSVRIRSP